MTTITKAPAAIEPAPDLCHPALSGYVASLPPDDDLARRAADLAEAYAAVAAERERGAALQRRRSALSATLGTATGADRTKMLHEILIVDADLATVPAAIGEATRRYSLARLAWFARLLALAEAEARELVARTDGPIGALGRAKQALDRASGYLDAAPNPAAADKLRADVDRLAAGLAPDVQAHRRATEAAALVRARVASAFGERVAGFDRSPYGPPTRSWAEAAGRAGEAAAARVRHETTG